MSSLQSTIYSFLKVETIDFINWKFFTTNWFTAVYLQNPIQL